MNKRTVWIVFNDRRKDFSKAEKFGELRDIFSSVGRRYNTVAMIEHCRHVLANAQEGDYLLTVGDPVLCCIAAAVMTEKSEKLNLLRWDREDFKYEPVVLDFSYIETDEDFS